MPLELDAPTRRRRDTVARNRTIHLRVTTSGLEAIDRWADQRGMSRSDALRVLLRKGMEAA